MPVGRPTDDGEIVKGSRHGTHAGGLGHVAVWDCPGCGKKNEGRTPEQGCVHCGAGDPKKSQAGGATIQPAAPPARPAATVMKVPQAARLELHQPAVAPKTLTMYRLIEYVITDGVQGAEVLRRSLVGRLEFPWGAITGAIVDSLDNRQEDLIRMAQMQPGVWLGNPTVSTVPVLHGVPGLPVVKPMIPHSSTSNDETDLFTRAARMREVAMDTPDTGPAYSQEIQQLAQLLLDLFERVQAGSGLRAIHTLALALSNVSVELEGNMEPEKFMSAAQCLQLANALLQLIPADWTPDAAEGATAP